MTIFVVSCCFDDEDDEENLLLVDVEKCGDDETDCMPLLDRKDRDDDVFLLLWLLFGGGEKSANANLQLK